MIPFGKFATASAAGLTLCATTSALAGSPARAVHMDCVAMQPLCAALGDAMRVAHKVVVSLDGDTTGTPQLVVRFEPTRQGAHALAGFLTWRDATGATGQGPEIELSVIDAHIQPEMLAEFARQLVANSSLPL